MSDRPPAQPKRKAPVDALVKAQKPDEVVAYYCTNCGTVYSDKNGTGKYDAERCSRKSSKRWGRSGHAPQEQTPCSEWTCEDCGEECSPYQWFCSKCIGKHRTDWEKAKLAKAEVVPDYPDDQGVFWGDRYFHCIDDLLEYCEYEDIPVPDRVWATAPNVFSLNVDEVLERAFEEWSEGADDVGMCDIRDVGRLRDAMESFNKGNKHLVLYCETSKAVDMTPYKGDDDEE